jgi:hypothetical protein
VDHLRDEKVGGTITRSLRNDGSVHHNESSEISVDTRSLVGSFSINLDLVDIPADDMTIFQNAANRWSSVIKQDLPDIPKKVRRGSG